MILNRHKVMLLLLAAVPFELMADDRSADQLTIAVASNFHNTAKKIALRFSRSTGIQVRIVAGSTGKLYAQIVNGAPYDVFLSADTERPQRLEDDGFVAADGFFLYAAGRLVLWSNDRRFKDKACASDFERGHYQYLAIANPGTAPYGAAAKLFLEAENLWVTAMSKLVYGENVSQTLQFVATGNATFGLVAESQIVGDLPFETTCLIRIHNAELTELLQQAGAVLSQAPNIDAARMFQQFIQSPAIRELISDSGYRYPRPTLEWVN